MNFQQSLLIFLLMGAFFLSCEKDDIQSDELSGDYEGYFIRTGPTVDLQPADVSITFQSGTFDGNSAVDRYPAICKGTFSEQGTDSLRFENSCTWTADFDWTYILDGTYAYSEVGDSIILERTYEGGELIDRYVLSR